MNYYFYRLTYVHSAMLLTYTNLEHLVVFETGSLIVLVETYVQYTSVTRITITLIILTQRVIRVLLEYLLQMVYCSL